MLALLLFAVISNSPSASAAPTNPVIDLSLPASAEPQSDQYVFDESVIFSPNFASNQNDLALSDLFGQGSVSNLCFPTTLAEALINLFAYHSPKFGNLKLADLSSDQKSIVPNDLVRQLATLCKTDANNGTDSRDAIACVTSVLTQSGYGLGTTQLISPFNVASTSPPILSRDVTISDIRNALQAGSPVLLEAAWFQFDPSTRSWVRHSGHYIGVYGYDYNRSWGENQIQLKIINPETVYSSNRQTSLWDTVTIIRVAPQPGITYPTHRPFILTGPGFGGLTKRGFLGMIIKLAPQQ